VPFGWGGANGGGGGGSVTSVEAQAISAQAASALSDARSALSVVDAGLSARIDSVHSVLSQRLSALVLDSIAGVSIVSPTDGQALMYNSAAGQWVNSTPPAGGGGSVTSTELSAGDAAVSAQAASALSNALSVLSVTDAALSVRIDSVANGVSIVSNALSNEISNRLSADIAVSAQAASALSQARSALSVVDAALSARIDSVANGVSVVSNALSNEISNRISADNAVSANAASANSDLRSAAVGQRVLRVASTTVSAATLTNVGSMVVSLTGGGYYKVEGWLQFQCLTSGGFAYGFSAPATGIGGAHFQFQMLSAVGQGPTDYADGGVALSQVVAGQTAVVSLSVLSINAPRNVNFWGFIHASATGTFQIMARASVAASGMVVGHGYIQAIRVG